MYCYISSIKILIGDMYISFQVSKKQLKEVQNQLNERPRKTLEYESPLNTISRLYMNQNFI